MPPPSLPLLRRLLLVVPRLEPLGRAVRLEQLVREGTELGAVLGLELPEGSLGEALPLALLLPPAPPAPPPLALALPELLLQALCRALALALELELSQLEAAGAAEPLLLPLEEELPEAQLLPALLELAEPLALPCSRLLPLALAVLQLLRLPLPEAALLALAEALALPRGLPLLLWLGQPVKLGLTVAERVLPAEALPRLALAAAL